MGELIAYSSFDSYLFHEGTHTQIYEKFGAHPCHFNKQDGTVFRIWAPNARMAEVMSDACVWQENRMTKAEDGVWECFLPGAMPGNIYRFKITGADGEIRYKSDPFAFYSEMRPENASVIYDNKKYSWNDNAWLNARTDMKQKPLSVYEVHLGSWKRYENGFLNYRQLAKELAEYVKWTGFTHVELMGICEYPFDGSWGYQVSGYYSATSRYGNPDGLKEFVDIMHQSGIGVIMDWVPAHFVKDAFALGCFDGTNLYEPSDPYTREYPEWGTFAFDYGKAEVRSFLISSAMYWINEFHMDGLRVDAVASMLYLDYARPKWTPNRYGDNRYLEGREFLKQLNQTVHRDSTAMTIAEDSSIERDITKPVEEGGYGFDFKWNMGWMNDTLKYMAKDPIYRRFHHGELIHMSDYAFTEMFVLVLSHDEVVHLKKSMFGKLPGTLADRFGNLKALYALQYAQPGKKLLFMGQEFAENEEWDENREINWKLAQDPGHREILLTVKELNRIYRKFSVLWKWDNRPETFQWINASDTDRNTVSFIRKSPTDYKDALIVVINFSRNHYGDYRIGIPEAGEYIRVFSTYDMTKGGGGPNETGSVPSQLSIASETDGYTYTLSYGLRPNEAVFFVKKDK